MNNVQNIVNFMRYAEALKTELRRASKSDGNRESVADHCWSLCLLLVLISPKLSVDLDLLRTLKMAIIHDLVEIEAKDISVLKHITNEQAGVSKSEKEAQAIRSIRDMLGVDGKEIYELWHEFEEQKTTESRVLKALDRIEGQLQFLSENITIFEDEEQPIIDHLIESTSELAKIDPVITEVYSIFLNELKERVLVKAT